MAGAVCSAPAAACELALVLAIDVSLSVDAQDYALQRNGTAQALLDPSVRSTLLANGSVMLSFMQWSGRNDHQVSIPWTSIVSDADLSQFAGRMQATQRAFQSGTAPGSAIAQARALHAASPTRCARKVIDVSGDGVENSGLRTRTEAARAISDGITINGLVILGEDDRVEPFYRHNVIGGDGAFIELANGYADYPRAIRDKLLKELPPLLAKAHVQ